MISSSDIILYKKKGFDGENYIKSQKEIISKKMSLYNDRIYLEIRGKLLYDSHAARTLPGYIPDTKKCIFGALKDEIEILFCVSAQDIIYNKLSYETHVQNTIKRIEIELGIKPHIIINNIDIQTNFDKILEFEQNFQRKNYKVWEKYKISGYPHNTKSILSDQGFGNDDHIPLTKKLILVTGTASDIEKTATCLGQIYNDNQINIESGYIKYELFPISKLSFDHPLNLAYEAATINNNTKCKQDQFHLKAYNKESTRNESEIDEFETTINIIKKTIEKNDYKSPTDMEISNIAEYINNDEITTIASYEEIKRRKAWYQEIIDRKEGEQIRLTKCDELLEKCEHYAKSKGYNLNQKIS